MAAVAKFIAIEGSDGSGKGTHSELLVTWLKGLGVAVHFADFPRYGNPSAHFVEEYLNGHFGALDTISAYKASLFYALDRYSASFAIRDALSAGKTVIANRYVGSNMAHQGGKLGDPADRMAYYKWNNNLEFSILGIPRPDLNIVLSMPPKHSSKLIDNKGKRDYILQGSRDIHEQDSSHLIRAYDTFNELTELFPKEFTKVNCTSGRGIRTIDDIQNELRRLVEAIL